MAVAHVQTIKTIDNDGGATTTTGSMTFSAGSLALLGIMQYRAAGARGITSVLLDATTAFTKDKEQTQASDGAAKSEIWSLPNVGAGAHTVTITWAVGGPERASVFFTEASGTATSSIADGTGGAATGTGAAAATGNFTTLADSFIYCACSFDTSNTSATVTAGTNWLIPTNGSETNGGPNIVAGVEYKANPGTTTHNGNWTNTNTEWAVCAFAYKVLAGGVVSPPGNSTQFLMLEGVGR